MDKRIQMILDKMIDYSIRNWKAICYESERETARLEMMDAKDGFIENLIEDLSNAPDDKEASDLLALVNTI